jgi:hypothetical protein
MTVAGKVHGKRNHLLDSVVGRDCNVITRQFQNVISQTNYSVLGEYIVPVLFALSMLFWCNGRYQLTCQNPNVHLGVVAQ